MDLGVARSRRSVLDRLAAAARNGLGFDPGDIVLGVAAGAGYEAHWGSILRRRRTTRAALLIGRTQL